MWPGARGGPAVALLAPAEAMRPPAPRAYQHGMLERLPGVRRMSARRLMILRRMTDRPVRSMLTIAGIALAAPIIVMSLFWQDALDEMIDVQFAAVERADVIVGFTDAVPGRAVREMAQLPGVLLAEAYRAVPVSSTQARAPIARRSPGCRRSRCCTG